VPANAASVLKAQLDVLQLQHFRRQFPAALDADTFELIG
jgi:hypothetical protein